MLFEEPSPRLPGEKWGRGSKRTDESAREDVHLGDRALALLRFRVYLNVIFKDHALIDELGI